MKVSTYRQLYQMEIFIGSSFDFSYLHRDIMFLVFFCPLFVFFFFVQGCNFFFIFVGPHFDFSLSYRDIFSNFISPLLSIGSQRGQCLMSSPPGHSSVLSYHIMSLSPPNAAFRNGRMSRWWGHRASATSRADAPPYFNEFQYSLAI